MEANEEPTSPTVEDLMAKLEASVEAAQEVGALPPTDNRNGKARAQALHNMTLHPPKTPQVGRDLDALRFAAQSWVEIVCDICPGGRELSQALTAAEDSLMYAVAAVARNQG